MLLSSYLLQLMQGSEHTSYGKYDLNVSFQGRLGAAARWGDVGLCVGLSIASIAIAKADWKLEWGEGWTIRFFTK